VRKKELRPMTDRERKLVEDNRGLVIHMVKKFVDQGHVSAHIEYEDLWQTGWLAMCLAAQLWNSEDPSGAKFSTYAGRAIFRDVWRALVRSCHPMHIPDNLLHTYRSQTISLEALSAIECGGKRMPQNLMVALKAGEPTPMEESDMVEEKLLVDAEVERLLRIPTKRERQAIRLRYGMDRDDKEAISFTCVGTRMGVSRQAAEQCFARGMSRIYARTIGVPWSSYHGGDRLEGWRAAS